MNFERAKLRAEVGFVLHRTDGPVFTGDQEGGFVDMQTKEPFYPSDEDEAATDWREV